MTDNKAGLRFSSNVTLLTFLVKVQLNMGSLGQIMWPCERHSDKMHLSASAEQDAFLCVVKSLCCIAR